MAKTKIKNLNDKEYQKYISDIVGEEVNSYLEPSKQD